MMMTDLFSDSARGNIEGKPAFICLACGVLVPIAPPSTHPDRDWPLVHYLFHTRLGF